MLLLPATPGRSPPPRVAATAEGVEGGREGREDNTPPHHPPTPRLTAGSERIPRPRGDVGLGPGLAVGNKKQQTRFAKKTLKSFFLFFLMKDDLTTFKNNLVHYENK